MKSGDLFRRSSFKNFDAELGEQNTHQRLLDLGGRDRACRVALGPRGGHLFQLIRRTVLARLDRLFVFPVEIVDPVKVLQQRCPNGLDRRGKFRGIGDVSDVACAVVVGRRIEQGFVARFEGGLEPLDASSRSFGSYLSGACSSALSASTVARRSRFNANNSDCACLRALSRTRRAYCS